MPSAIPWGRGKHTCTAQHPPLIALCFLTYLIVHFCLLYIPELGVWVMELYPNLNHFCDVLLAAYIGEMFKVLEESADVTFKDAAQTLKKLTPAPMNRMLQRMPREEALKKHEARKLMKTIDVPATGTSISPYLLVYCFTVLLRRLDHSFQLT